METFTKELIMLNDTWASCEHYREYYELIDASGDMRAIIRKHDLVDELPPRTHSWFLKTEAEYEAQQQREINHENKKLARQKLLDSLTEEQRRLLSV